MRSRRFPVPTWLLLRIAERDGWLCRICDQGYMPGDRWKWEIDHDKPLAKGGTNHVSNLRLTHLCCNRGEGAA